MPIYRRAIGLAEEQLKINPRNADALGWLANYHAMLGERKTAQDYLDRALVLASADADMRLRAALVYITFGDRDRSIRWLEKAVAAGLPQSQIRGSPGFDTLASDARFRRLIQQNPGGPVQKES
jgi:tetratricopeptide (TPR) repeat protein